MLYGTYEIGNAIGEYRNMASIGFKDRIKLPWDLFANVGYEKTKSLETELAETGMKATRPIAVRSNIFRKNLR